MDFLNRMIFFWILNYENNCVWFIKDDVKSLVVNIKIISWKLGLIFVFVFN